MQSGNVYVSIKTYSVCLYTPVLLVIYCKKVWFWCCYVLMSFSKTQFSSTRYQIKIKLSLQMPVYFVVIFFANSFRIYNATK